MVDGTRRTACEPEPGSGQAIVTGLPSGAIRTSATRPVRVRGEVLSVKRVGAYLLLLAPGSAAQVRPGHFAALAVGDEPSQRPCCNSISIYRAEDGGV